jgi:hypothetical protein
MVADLPFPIWCIIFAAIGAALLRPASEANR